MNNRTKENRALALGEPKLVSIIMPSRGRVKYLKKSLESICDKTSDLSKVQVIIRFDNDDLDSIKEIPNLPFSKLDIDIVIGQRMRGYHDLNKFVNQCCGVSRGDFLLLFNDDSYIVTENWDLKLEKFIGETVVLNPDTHDDAQAFNTFPIMSRDIYDLLGYFSLQAHNDTWISYIARSLGIQKHIDISIFHDRPDNPNYTGTNEERMRDDPTWAERTNTFPNSMGEFSGHKFSQLRSRDSNLIKKNLL
jgi:glycosyltransferase involved in cell wall biosynthesis